MRKIITIFICLLPFFGNAQTANAGSDKLVYITQGNSTFIGGTSSGDSYMWTALTDSVPRSTTGITNPATIVSPTKQKTLIRNLVQGAWPYKIAVTTGLTTVYDTVVIRVAYAPPPINSTKLDSISTSSSFSSLAKPSTVGGYSVLGFNDRSDTVNYYTASNAAYGRANWNDAYTSYKFVNDQTMFWIPPTMTTLFGLSHDGTNAGDGYLRTQISMGSKACPEGNMDSSHIYMMEQQMYFTKNPSIYFRDNQHDVLFGFDLHGHSTANPFSLSITYPNKVFVQDAYTGNTVTKIFPTSTISTDDLTNNVHTFRLYQKLGKKGFIKMYYDGVLLYERAGDVGDSYNADYSDNWPQWGGFYDHSAELVDYSNTTRNRSICIGTTAWRFYSLSDTAQFTQAPHPTISLSGDQSISETSATVFATPVWASGHSGTVTWSKIGGSGTPTITPSGYNAAVSGLQTGSYVFRCTATQDDGQSTYAEVMVNVSISNPVPPTGVIIFRTPHKFINL